jgi:hypothetical protein
MITPSGTVIGNVIINPHRPINKPLPTIFITLNEIEEYELTSTMRLETKAAEIDERNVITGVAIYGST